MGYVTVLVHSGALLSSRSAAALVNLARHSWGKTAWQSMDVDAFPGGETLLIARPQTITNVRIADYALPFLHKFFTD